MFSLLSSSTFSVIGNTKKYKLSDEGCNAARASYLAAPLQLHERAYCCAIEHELQVARPLSAHSKPSLHSEDHINIQKFKTEQGAPARSMHRSSEPSGTYGQQTPARLPGRQQQRKNARKSREIRTPLQPTVVRLTGE